MGKSFSASRHKDHNNNQQLRQERIDIFEDTLDEDDYRELSDMEQRDLMDEFNGCELGGFVSDPSQGGFDD